MKGVSGRTALHEAANHEGEPHLERLLRETGLPIDVRDDQGMTPLHWASEAGCPEVIRTLARLGASVDLLDGAGHSPLDLAVLSREPLTLEALFQCGAKVARLESLVEAAKMGSTFAMERLPKDTAGLACCVAETDRVDLLEGLDVNAADAGGMRPLFLARSVEMTRALLARGADVRVTDLVGNTVLHALSHFSTPEQVRVLLEAGADQRARNARGLTPLENALELSLHPAMELLGPVYEFVPEDLAEPGWSVTHYAAALGSASAVRGLEAAGRLDEKSDDGFTVADQALAFRS